jgi:pyruvate,water dikinase
MVLSARDGSELDTVGPVVLGLDDARARDRQLTGTKAANLAVARQAGLPVYDGFVLTTLGTSDLDDAEAAEAAPPGGPLHEAWRRLSEDGRVALAVRSSSVIEDTTTSSMAGRFVSVLHVVGWAAFVAAVSEVVASAASTEIADAPMAVLVQPMGDASIGGVLFGLDPLTGDRSRVRISVAEGLPDQIVGGAVTGAQLVVGRRGRLRSVQGPVPAGLRPRHRAQLAGLARRTAALFGGPQDVEWLIERSGALRLLQSRPITASALPPEHSHLLGPGPVAETFPNPLHPLERDLWVPPLEDGIREALRISGAVRPRATAPPFVVDVGGRIAVDLEALGVVDPPSSFVRRLDPRPPARHLRAAWRIGRLRTALGGIVHDLLVEVDGHLAAVPRLEDLDDLRLLRILANGQQTLAALHAYEVLAGFFLDEGVTATTGASVALAALAQARRDGVDDDDEVLATQPVVLALLPPEIGGDRRLPPTVRPRPTPTGAGDPPLAIAREALRLRIRWTHELMACAAEALGRRAARRGLLPDEAAVRDLRLVALRALVLDPEAVVPPAVPEPEVPPLPARFRLAADGSVVPDVDDGGRGPLGVSAGRAIAVVTEEPEGATGKVLVVPSLAPSLAGVLGGVAALVSETGSPLSHLAILAREQGIPVVVGVTAGRDGVVPGALVLVDGTGGVVEVLSPVDEELEPGDEVAGAAGPPVEQEAR